MAKVNLNGYPYYDDYDSSKRYTQLLARPGRVAQAREITQIQSTVKDIIKSIGDSILKDGDIIEGCQVIPRTVESQRRVYVSAGKVYLNGMVLPVDATSLPLPVDGTGNVEHEVLVGIKLNEIVITESLDSSLLDPAVDYDNAGKPGCDRLRTTSEVVVFTPSNPNNEAAVISTLIDGELSVENNVPEYDKLSKTLADRTYEESGSYIVEGLKIRVEENADDTKFTVVAEPGLAYIAGYRLKLPTARKITVPKAITYRVVSDEPHTYNSNAEYESISSLLNIKSITAVEGTMQTSISQTATAQGSRVPFPEGVVVTEVVSVTQGDTTFSIGNGSSNDCYRVIDNGRYYLQWTGNSTGNTLTTQSSYTVVYKYVHTFTEGTDYELSYGVDNNNQVSSQGISWITAGDKPIDGTDYNVTYESYLARKDVVYIDYKGTIAVLEGTPALSGTEMIPDIPSDTLALAHISSPAGGEVSSTVSTTLNIQASNIGLTRFTMSDIQKLLNRIRILEYDQTILSLNDEARQYNTGTSSKKGIWTDSLIDLSKIDYYYNLNSISFDCTIDLNASICYLPLVTGTYDAIYDEEGSTSRKYTKIATLNKLGETILLSQPKATKSFAINPYSAYPQLPEISITPSIDTWIEDSIINIPVSLTSTEVVSAHTKHIERFGSGSSSTSYVDTTIGTRVESTVSESVISEEAVSFIREREITVEGIHYPPNLDHIRCYFDGAIVPVTRLDNTPEGEGTSNSFMSKGDGTFKIKFTIPANVPTGIREVRVGSDIIREGYESSAFTLYQASGTKRVIEKTVTTLTNILVNRVTTVTTVQRLDPIGQTFILNKMAVVSGINLYFESKPTTGNTPVTCEIREVLNGSITPTIYAHRTLSASEVNTTGATRFDFEDPILLEENKEYAFVVRSTSTYYNLWVADLGGIDVSTQETVLSNPYLIGVMMSSSNNSSWTTHQTTDVKFDIIADLYDNTSEIAFEEIESTEDFSRIYLAAESIIPNGTSISWFYSLDGGTTYESITPYNIKLLNSTNSNLKLKAQLYRNSVNENLSPILAIESIGTTLSRYETTGYYVSKNTSNIGFNGEGYTNVDIILDTYEPAGTAVQLFLSRDRGTTILPTPATVQSNPVELGYGWKEKTYKMTVESAEDCKLFIKMTSDHQYTTPSVRRVRMIMS